MKVNNLPEITELSDNDLLLVYSAEQEIVGITKLSTLKDYLNVIVLPTLPTLTFASNGDSNGICYWLATKDGAGWSNPHTSDKLTVIANAVSAGSLANIVDRAGGVSNYTPNTANGYWGIDFKTHKLIPTDCIIRHDNNSGYALRSFQIQGSNDGSTFTTLDTQFNNTTLNSPGDWLRVSLTGITTGYRVLRVLMTGVNSAGTNEFCCGELEFYGEVVAL